LVFLIRKSAVNELRQVVSVGMEKKEK